MNWFRLYSEARNDAKLRTLTDAEHRVWFNLLCYAAEQKPERGVITDFDMDVLAIEVAGGDTDLLIEVLKKLSRLRIVYATQGSEIRFLKFESRQYDKPSDAPAAVKERVSAHREKQRNAAAQQSSDTPAPETPGNAEKRDETPGNAEKRLYSEDTQSIHREENTQNAPSERETPAPAPARSAPKSDKSRPRHNPKAFDAVYGAYPKHENRIDAVKAWDSERPDVDMVDTMLTFIENAKQTDRWKRNMVPAFDIFLRKQKWTDDLTAYADSMPPSGSFAPRASPNGSRAAPPLGQSALAAASAEREARFKALRENQTRLPADESSHQ